MKLSDKIYIGSAISLAIFGGVCAADPGGLVTDLTRASQSPTVAIETPPSSSQSETPSDTQTTPETTPSDLGVDVATADPSTVSSAPIAAKPKPVYGNCRHYSDGSTYTCEVPQTALATAPAPDPTPTPVLTDQERQDVTVPNNNQDPTPTPTPTPDPNVQQDPAQ